MGSAAVGTPKSSGSFISLILYLGVVAKTLKIQGRGLLRYVMAIAIVLL
jgi:hypothetical protein